MNEEVLSALARFFDEGRGPSHDELDRLFMRAGLRSADPRAAGESTVGKMKRVRAVLGYAIDNEPENAESLVKSLLGGLRACGGFREGSDNFPGEDAVRALRSAFRGIGLDLDSSGTLRPVLLERLEGVQLTEALWAYVRRARTGAADPELVIGTAKNLEEAAAGRRPAAARPDRRVGIGNENDEVRPLPDSPARDVARPTCSSASALTRGGLARPLSAGRRVGR